MKEPPIAYIHIGLEKTGTTTLQEFAYQNRNLLAEDNIYYPDSPGLKNHTNLPAYAYDKNLNDLAERKNITNPNDRIYFRNKFEEEFKNEIRPIRDKKMHLLVSSEHLSSRVGDETEIRKLLSLFTSLKYQPKIIVYLRRQDEMLLSTYSTWVKCGATEDMNLNAFQKKRYDYLAQLRLWENTVGKENIMVGLFHRDRLFKGDLILDFCDKINIDPSRYNKPEAKLNKSLSAIQLEYLKGFNIEVPELIGNKKNEFRGDITNALESIDDNQKAQLPIAIKNQIQNYFQAQNAEIKEKYFQDLNSPLFPFSLEDNINNKRNSPNIAEAIKNISIKLWKFQQNKINKLNQTYRDQHRYITKLEEELKELKRKLLS